MRWSRDRALERGWLGANSFSFWQTSHPLIEHGGDDRVQVGRPAQMFHPVGVRVLLAHGLENGLEGGAVLRTVHGGVPHCAYLLRDRGCMR